MNDIRDSRLLEILKINNQEFYLCTLAFCMLAEEKWITDKNRYTVKHGYVHIKNILSYIDIIFENKTDEEIIKILSAKYIFILLSSIYVHDMGMQDFYQEKLIYLRNLEDLKSYDYENIRINHADIISDKLSSLKDINHLFSQNIIKKLIAMNDSNSEDTIDILERGVLNNRRHIALVASFHNKTISTLSTVLINLSNQKELFLEKNETEKIIFTASLLQFSDAIDMSISRINVQTFLDKIDKINQYHNQLSKIELNLAHKLFLCYIIDEVKLKNEESKLILDFKMSVPLLNLTNHTKYIEESKAIYEKRLKRHEKDCIVNIETFLKIKIYKNLSGEKIKANPHKKVLKDKFFTLKEKDNKKNIRTLVNEAMDSLEDDCTFSYFKLYSGLTNIYHGGLARRVENEECEELEKLFFYGDDWKFEYDAKIDCEEETKKITDLLQNKSNLKYYTKYVKLCNSKKIETELYFLVKSENEIIGFINMHYDRKLVKKEIKEKCILFENNLKYLGENIAILHRQEYAKKFKNFLDSIQFLQGDNSKYASQLYNMFYGMYSSHDRQQIKLDTINIEDFKKIVFNEPIVTDTDKKYQILINKDLFISLYSFIFGNILCKNNVNFIPKIINLRTKQYIEFNLQIETSNIPAEKYEIIELTNYLNKIDVMEFDLISVKKLEYFILIKSFFTVLSGNVTANYIDDKNILEFIILIPKKMYNKS